MKKLITVRGVTIGSGIPKICVSLMGRTIAKLTEEAAYLKTLDVDVVEWRADFFDQIEDIAKVKDTLNVIRDVLIDVPLLFTFRTKQEGGDRDISLDYYFELNREIVKSKQADMIDIELFTEEQQIKELVKIAREHNVFVIISNHDFRKTPSKEEIILRLNKAQALGADIPKIAVMPQTTADVLTLLAATTTMNEEFADRPIITMSMGGNGVISRIAGEIFGSAITFGAAKKASAPGQIPVKELQNVLNLLHSSK